MPKIQNHLIPLNGAEDMKRDLATYANMNFRVVIVLKLKIPLKNWKIMILILKIIIYLLLSFYIL